MKYYRVLERPPKYEEIIEGLRKVIDNEPKFEHIEAFFNAYPIAKVLKQVPELYGAFEFWGCPTPACMGFYCSPGKDRPSHGPHIDDSPAEWGFGLVTVNFPVYNVEMTEIQFYEPLPGKESEAEKKSFLHLGRDLTTTWNGDGVVGRRYDRALLRKVASVDYSDAPIVFRNDKIHYVYNPRSTRRWTATFRFNREIDPWFLLER